MSRERGAIGDGHVFVPRGRGGNFIKGPDTTRRTNREEGGRLSNRALLNLTTFRKRVCMRVVFGTLDNMFIKTAFGFSAIYTVNVTHQEKVEGVKLDLRWMFLLETKIPGSLQSLELPTTSYG